jgi:hypothetical protein
MDDHTNVDHSGFPMTTQEQRAYRLRMWAARHEAEVRRISLTVTTLAVRRFFDAAGCAPAAEVVARLRAFPSYAETLRERGGVMFAPKEVKE